MTWEHISILILVSVGALSFLAFIIWANVKNRNAPPMTDEEKAEWQAFQP